MFPSKPGWNRWIMGRTGVTELLMEALLERQVQEAHHVRMLDFPYWNDLSTRLWLRENHCIVADVRWWRYKRVVQTRDWRPCLSSVKIIGKPRWQLGTSWRNGSETSHGEEWEASPSPVKGKPSCCLHFALPWNRTQQAGFAHVSSRTRRFQSSHLTLKNRKWTC